MTDTLSTITDRAAPLALAACLLAAGAAPAAARQAAAPVAQTGAAPAAQSEDLARGRALLDAGDPKGAARFFREATRRSRADADAWHLLGVALARAGDEKGARKALEAALKLRPDSARTHAALAYVLLAAGKLGDAERRAMRALELDPGAAEAHYVRGVLKLWQGDAPGALEAAEAALRADEKFVSAHLLKCQALVGYSDPGPRPIREMSLEELRQRRLESASRLREAAESLEKFLRLSPPFEGVEMWRQQLEALRFYGRYVEERAGRTNPDAGGAGIGVGDGPPRTIFASADDDGQFQKAVILRKPEPDFTERARKSFVTGTVRLRAVLADDGTVKHILVLRGLPHGLTEKAVAAARAIKFRPALHAGRPVSQYVMLEYNFNIY